MNSLAGKRLVVLSNVHKVHDCRIYYREAYFAAQRGMNVSVLALDDGVRSDSNAILAFPAPRSRIQRFFLGWKLAYLAYRRNADICHFHDPEMLLPMLAYKLITRRCVIYDCHENVVDSIYYKKYLPKAFRPAIAKLTYCVQWLCAKAIGSVIIVTQEQLEMFPRSIKHMVLRNYPPQFIQQTSIPHEQRPFDLVHCGSFSKERGSHVILEMLRILVCERGWRNCRMLLIGVTKNDLDRDSQRMIDEHNLDANISFLGYLPLDQVPQHLGKARIGIMCHQSTRQYRYGVASKLFDYMAAGLAIVGGYADFDQEFAPADSVKLYTDQTDPHALACAVEQLLLDKAKCAQMGENARQLFEERFTAESQVDTLMTFYKSTVCRKAA